MLQDPHPAETAPAPPMIRTEVHAIPIDDRAFIFYAPLRRVAFVGNSATARLLDRLRDPAPSPLTPREQDLVEFLDKAGVLGAGDADPISSHAEELKPTRATLLLTTGCNLRCSYCYASAGDRPVKRMPFEVAARGIDYIVSNAVELGRNAIELYFHGGGEPTTNWPVLTGALEYAKRRAAEHGLQVLSYMGTNGVFDMPQLDWIAAHLDGLTISFDGLPVLHDKFRFFQDGRPSSERVMQTMRLLDERNFSYGVRVTVTAEAIGKLPDSVEYIYTMCHPRLVQVEPVYRLGRGENADSAETEEFIDSFRLARDRARDRGGDLTFSPVRVGALTDHFCEATKGSFCLSTGGNVTSCYEVFDEDQTMASHFFFGKPDSERGYAFDDGVLNELRSQSVANRKFCEGCFARWDCAGDCYHKGLTSGDNGLKGAGRCHIIRELSKDMLLDKITAAGGVVWQGNGNGVGMGLDRD